MLRAFFSLWSFGWLGWWVHFELLCSFSKVVGSTEQLKILNCVLPALGNWFYVVKVQVLFAAASTTLVSVPLPYFLFAAKKYAEMIERRVRPAKASKIEAKARTIRTLKELLDDLLTQ